MGRAPKEPTTQLLILVPKNLYAELLLINPEMTNARGTTKYGAVSGYFTNLMRTDVERRKVALKESANNG